MKMPHSTVGAALLALALAAIPAGAFAQPSYAQGANEETIHGSIVSLDGAGNLQLRDDRGFVDSVRLEPNVNVSPAGVQLQPGMRVTITGANAGPVFAAETVAAAPGNAPAAGAPPSDPYAYQAPYAAYPYPYPVYAYPYPVYAYPSYPRFSIGIGFGPGWGFRGRWR